MTRIDRLRTLLKLIEKFGDAEVNFALIYAELLQEIDLETLNNSDLTTNAYLRNLLLTRDVQAGLYINTKKKKRRISPAQPEFKDFIFHFTQDLKQAIDNV